MLTRVTILTRHQASLDDLFRAGFLAPKPIVHLQMYQRAKVLRKIGVRGWRKQVAEEFGIHPNSVSRVIKKMEAEV